MRVEGVEDGGHDHAQLVAGDDGQDHCQVLPCYSRRRSPPVPDKNCEEEDEPHEVCPDIHCFIVERENRSEALAELLWCPVPDTGQYLTICCDMCELYLIIIQ